MLLEAIEGFDYPDYIIRIQTTTNKGECENNLCKL